MNAQQVLVYGHVHIITLQNQKDAYWREVNASWRRMNASRRKMSI